MQNSAEAHTTRPPSFRPPLAGCVAQDRRMANALFLCYADTFASIAANVHRSLLCRERERAAEALFDRLAEEDLAEFRLLGELIMALGGSGDVRLGNRRSARHADEAEDLLSAAIAERRAGIDRYRMLLSRTGDRVVRSVISKLLSEKERSLAELERGVDRS